MTAADNPRRMLHQVVVVVLALAAGTLFDHFGVPLPWVLGPLIVSAAAALGGMPLPDRRSLLNTAQVVIGAAVGAGFTASMLAALLPLLPWMVGFSLWSIAIAALLSLLLARFAPLDRQSALLANLPGGVAEMAFIGDAGRGGASAISLIQALRVASLVLLLPPLLGLALEDTGQATTLTVTNGAFGAGTLIVLGLGYAGGRLLNGLGMKNAFIVAALLVALAGNMFGLLDAGIPEFLFTAAQVVIGLALGTRFERDEMRRLPRVMAIGLGVSLLTSIVIVASALLLAWLIDYSPAALVLGGAPGGVAEMTLTATALGLPVPEVVVFQMVRIVIVNTSAGFLASLWLRMVGSGLLAGR
jgi:membrane AbrB-like protein